VFEPPSSGGDPGAQIHDFNPGIQADGLFWTLALSDSSVAVNLSNGFASMSATDLAVQDYHDFTNAISGGGPGIPGPSDPAQVSFTVIWSGANSLTKLKNTAAPSDGGGFAGEFVRNVAQMEWSATVGDLQYVSDPLATSGSAFAEIGHERNGFFFA
jgi:hypothetical protein